MAYILHVVYFSTVLVLLLASERVETRLLWIPRLENADDTSLEYYKSIEPENEKPVRNIIHHPVILINYCLP